MEDEREEEKETITRGEVIQDVEAEAHDIRERGIHHLDLRERLPWLKAAAKKAGTENEGRVTSPDSGVDPHSPEETSPSHDSQLEPVENDHHSTAGSVHSLLQNGHLEEIYLPPKDYHEDSLPPKDYPHSTEAEAVPPKDYPKSVKPENKPAGSQAEVLADDDYYSMMMNGF